MNEHRALKRSVVLVAGLAAVAFLAVPFVNAAVSRPSSATVPTSEITVAQPEVELDRMLDAVVPQAQAPAVAETSTPAPAAMPDAAQATLVQPNELDDGYQAVALPGTFETGELAGLSPADAAPIGADAGRAVAPAGSSDFQEYPWMVPLLWASGGAAVATLIWHDDIFDADDDDDDDGDVSVIVIDEF